MVGRINEKERRNEVTAAVFCVVIAIILGIMNFRKTRKAIERTLDREFLNQARQDISVFEECSKEDRKKTADKLKQLKKLKGKYND